MRELEGKCLLEEIENGSFYVDLDGQLVKVVLYSDVERYVDRIVEVSKLNTSSQGARKLIEYNGFTICSHCKSRVVNPSDARFCSMCGRKFINS